MTEEDEEQRPRIWVQRPVLGQDELNKSFCYDRKQGDAGLGNSARAALGRACSTRALKRIVPILDWLILSYNWRTDFFADLMAGATIGIINVPQGMAYSMLAGVHPITGIYMAFYPALTYTLFGTSRHISIGTFAVVCIMTGSSISAYGDEYSPLEIATAVSFLVGCTHIIMSFLKLGTLANFLSDPLVVSFSVGAGVHALTSQLKDLLGVKLPALENLFTVPLTCYELALALPKTNWAAVVVSLISIVILSFHTEIIKPFLSKRCSMPLPIELILVTIASLIGWQTDLFSSYNLKTVGDIPTGLKSFTLPPFEVFPQVAVDAVAIALVSYMIAASLALMIASRSGYEVDGNQELFALGCANMMGSFFSCLPVTASPSRSWLQLSVGGRTQLVSVFSCGILLTVLLWIGPFFSSLPRCVLASVIVVALKPVVFQVKDVVKHFKLSFLDGMLWLLTFLSTAFVGLIVGLGVGVVATIAILLIHGSTPRTCTLEQLPGTEIYVDTKRYRNTAPVKGVQIFQFIGVLNFASQGTLKRRVRNLLQSHRSKNAMGLSNPTHSLVIDLSGVTRVDPAGISTLMSIRDDLSVQQVNLTLAAANITTFETINKYCRLQNVVGFDIFPTIHDAVVFAEGTGSGSSMQSIVTICK